MKRRRPKTGETADEIEAGKRRHEAREAVVRRACAVMGWDYHQSPVLTGIRKVALGEAVAISVEKLHELLDRISPRADLCEHGRCFSCGYPNRADGCCSRPGCCDSE